jgi:hypothetical protein
MKLRRTVVLASCVLGVAGIASAQSFQDDLRPLVRESCVRCHGVRTVTPLNLIDLDYDLTDRDTFATWQKVYGRLERGEMPPATAPQPNRAAVDTALASLKTALTDANLSARGGQRTPLRRLTRLEYGHTISDLLGVDEEIGEELGQSLPAEADSGGFDTVAANQAMSALHVQSYLAAADAALDAALVVGPPPPVDLYHVDYGASQYLYGIANARAIGLGSVLQLDDAYVQFFDFTSTYTFHSMSEGIAIPYPGRYKVTVEAYPYQAETPVGLMVYRGRLAGVAASLDDLIGAYDLTGDEPTTVEITTFMRPGDLIGLSPIDADVPPDADPSTVSPADPADGFIDIIQDFPGEGVALKSLRIEGPILDAWPPESTRRLLAGVEFDADGEIQLTKDPYAHVVDVVTAFAPRAFRRSLDAAEIETFASLARPLLDEGRPFIEAVRVPLRAILSAPPFLFHGGAAASSAELDEFELATRLSYFLWRSMPDEALLAAARDGRLSDPSVLPAQVDRMLDDPKASRFVNDFAGQAFRIYELRSTTPDPGLYPEYEDRLGQAMAWETQLFFGELIASNLGAGALIDADFTFLNRRLADHYGVPGVVGMEMRKVDLPAGSPRGGLITQASVHKITSNGTTTSPIPRGNFVLANLLGRPAPPPPAAVAIPEPDTRGTTTIREQLDAHRASPVCANCHRTIDPPGFAMESFDPIGGFRTSYRISGGEMEVAGGFTVPLPFAQGAPVDASGVTPAGDPFDGVEEYKQILLDTELDAVARHLASQLLVFSTGAEVEFADRVTVDAILEAGRADGHPVRTMLHRVVGSDLFRQR